MIFSRPRTLALIASIALLSGALFTPPAKAADDVSRYIYPLSRPLRSPRVTIDVSDAPDLRPWAEQAQKLMVDWFPHLTQLLATEDWKAPRTLKLVLKKGIGPPAYTSGDTITAKAEWVRDHPDDFGMVIHELTHVVQAYHHRGNPGWLVEGVADYIRWWRYEPESRRTPVDPQKASYRDSYRTTANFLAWVVGRYSRRLVPELDRAMKKGTYSDEIFKTVTGKSLDDLWAEFVSTLPPR
jgi:hypothetical protein